MTIRQADSIGVPRSTSCRTCGVQRQVGQRQEVGAAQPKAGSGQEQGEEIGENHGTAEPVPQPERGAGVHRPIVIRPDALLAVVLVVQFRTTTYRAGVYWHAVALISVVGTLISDNLTGNMGVPRAPPRGRLRRLVPA